MKGRNEKEHVSLTLSLSSEVMRVVADPLMMLVYMNIDCDPC